MNTPGTTTITPELLKRFRDMRDQQPFQPMPPIIEFFGEDGLEAVAMCNQVDRDDALNIIYMGTTGFNADRVVLCMDVFLTTQDEFRRDALVVLEADRSPDGPVILRQAHMPYTVAQDGSIAWDEPSIIMEDEAVTLDGTIVDCFRDSFARPKTIDTDVEGTFIADIAKSLFGMSRAESRVMLRAATACVLTGLETCQLMVGASSEADRESISAFMERTANIGGINVN